MHCSTVLPTTPAVLCAVLSQPLVRPHRGLRAPSLQAQHRAGRAFWRSTAHCQAGPEVQKLFSPSKVNLFLRILRRRPDGYHDLASLFQVISFGDDITFQSGARGDELTCNDPDVPTDNSNLVLKALNLFRKHTGTDMQFQVHLQKRVPAGAGLGGGSGNAATALWAANEAAGRPASESDLLRWAGEIGSDISVFFSQGSAFCTGRGEIVDPVQSSLPESVPLLLVKPPIGLSTPEIFKALDLSRASQADPQQLLQAMLKQGLSQELCVNDLEQPAFDRAHERLDANTARSRGSITLTTAKLRLPELRELKQRLQAEGSFSAVFMSGSGSTIVCAGSSEAPQWLQEPAYADTLVTPAQLLTRQQGQWYTAP